MIMNQNIKALALDDPQAPYSFSVFSSNAIKMNSLNKYIIGWYVPLYTCFQAKITTGQSPLNVSLWTEGRTHTGPSPLDNMTA